MHRNLKVTYLDDLMTKSNIIGRSSFMPSTAASSTFEQRHTTIFKVDVTLIFRLPCPKLYLKLKNGITTYH